MGAGRIRPAGRSLGTPDLEDRGKRKGEGGPAGVAIRERFYKDPFAYIGASDTTDYRDCSSIIVMPRSKALNLRLLLYDYLCKSFTIMVFSH